jgi:phosphatidylglycerophosphatase A
MPSAAVLAPDSPPRRPSLRFMLSHPAHVIALGFGSGLAPFAPGTWGTLWAWIAFIALQRWVAPAHVGAVIALSLPIGWWACTVTADHLGVADPSAVVWDEIVCFWIVLWLLMPASWGAQLAAFLIFRVFDAAKPGPMGWADRRFKGSGWRGGFGILADDLVAAFCTLLVLALWRAWT